MFGREREEAGEISTQSVDVWVEANFSEIYRELERERLRKLVRLGDGAGRAYAFNRTRRWLSEMPLCEFWRWITPPSGFKKIYVEIYVNLQKPYEPHIFTAAADQILCMTPGQFVYLPDEESGPGDRTRILQEKAPDLIKVYGDGVARLFGKRDDIYNRLGISYC